MGNVNETLKNNKMTREEREQYLFGPWLSEIKSEEDIPPQYFFKKDVILNSGLAVKVPVNKDRKDLDPGMLMYKQVLMIEEDQLQLFSASSQGVDEVVIPLSEIIFVVRGGELLSNYITFGTAEKVYRIEYYSVSRELTSRILMKVRMFFELTAQSVNVLDGEFEDVKDTLLYKYFTRKEYTKEPMRVVAYQPEAKLKMAEANIMDIFINRLKQPKLEEVMFLTNGKELIIASGDIDKGNEASVDYSYRHCYIRLDSLKGFLLSDDAVFDDTKVLTVETVGQNFLINVKEGFDLSSLNDLIYGIHQ